jgi:hypothetical protein
MEGWGEGSHRGSLPERANKFKNISIPSDAWNKYQGNINFLHLPSIYGETSMTWRYGIAMCMIGHLSCTFAWVAKSGNTSERAPRGREGERGREGASKRALFHTREKNKDRETSGACLREKE